MTALEKLIGDLLLQHNCVVVPSFGGFVAQRISASIDAEKGTISPPRKSILFNKQLINNDGLLVSAYAQNQGIQYESAQTELQHEIREWNARLQMGGRITIDRVGNLFLDQEHNLCFEQDRFFNLLMESYGLSSVRFISSSDIQAKESHQTVTHVVKALELEQKQQVGETHEPTFVLSIDQPIVPVPEKTVQSDSRIIDLKSQRSSAWRYVAAACLLPIAFYSVWLPVKTDVLESGVLSLSDFNPFNKSIPGTYQPADLAYTFQVHPVRKQLVKLPDNVSVFSYELDEETYIPVSLKKEEAKTEPIVEESTETATSTTEITPEKPATPLNPTVNKSGELIVGSYLNRESASDLKKKLTEKGLSPHFIESDGKIRLSAGSASDMKTIMPILNELGVTPWVLR